MEDLTESERMKLSYKDKLESNDYEQTNNLYLDMHKLKSKFQMILNQDDTNSSDDNITKLTRYRKDYRILDIVAKIKQRVSFYGIYRLYDKFEMFR